MDDGMKFCTTLALLLLTTGCETYQTATVANPNDGAVVLRLAPNVLDGTAPLRYKNYSWVTVAREPSHGELMATRYKIAAVLEDVSHTAVFGRRLPPGTYRVAEFSGGGPNQIGLLEVDADLGKFRIESGRLTDLGVMIPSPFNHDWKSVLTYDRAADHPETPEIIRALLPGLAGLKWESSQSWVPESVPADMAQMRSYDLHHAIGLASPRVLDDGGFIYGTSIGMLREVRPGPRLLDYDVGSRTSIDSVLVSSAGHWFVGGEFGLLSVSRDRGRTWQSVRGNVPFGTVVDLAQWHDKIIATTVSGKDVYIHAAPDGGGEWRQLAHYQADIGFIEQTWEQKFGKYLYVRARSFVVADNLITTMPGRKLASVDLNTGQSDMHALPGEMRMLSVSGDGVLHCRFGVTGSESRDLGKTWKDFPVSSSMIMSAFRDAKHGVAVNEGITLISPLTKLTYTEDGGLTWTGAGDGPTGGRAVFYSKDGSVAYVGDAHGWFWESHDDGKTWKPVFPESPKSR